MRKMIVALLLIGTMGWWIPNQAAAAENNFESSLKDGFYGGLAGALVGGAILVFKDDPGDHLN